MQRIKVYLRVGPVYKELRLLEVMGYTRSIMTGKQMVVVEYYDEVASHVVMKVALDRLILVTWE